MKEGWIYSPLTIGNDTLDSLMSGVEDIKIKASHTVGHEAGSNAKIRLHWEHYLYHNRRKAK